MCCASKIPPCKACFRCWTAEIPRFAACCPGGTAKYISLVVKRVYRVEQKAMYHCERSVIPAFRVASWEGNLLFCYYLWRPWIFSKRWVLFYFVWVFRSLLFLALCWQKPHSHFRSHSCSVNLEIIFSSELERVQGHPTERFGKLWVWKSFNPLWFS